MKYAEALAFESWETVKVFIEILLTVINVWLEIKRGGMKH